MRHTGRGHFLSRSRNLWLPGSQVSPRLGGAAAAPAFVSTWDTRNTSTGSSNSDQIKLPLTSAGTYDFEVDWGDGNSDTITEWDQAEVTHTYAAAGEYEVTITGVITGWRFNNSGDRLKILTVDGGGVLNPGSENNHFWVCTNLTSLSGLDTSGVTNMDGMFRTCSALTSLDVSSFDTSSVTIMRSMFSGCSGVTSLDVSGFDTSSCTSMLNMFENCSGLTSLNVTGFSTSLVTDMRQMFKGCTNLAGSFDPSGFDVTALEFASGMMDGTSLATAVYDVLLAAWEAQAVNDSVSLHAGSSTYTAGSAAATARAALINDHSWTITDGGTA